MSKAHQLVIVTVSTLAVCLPQGLAVANAPMANAPAPASPDVRVSAASSTTRLDAKTPLNEALLGHWVDDDGETHYFFSRDRVTVVSLLDEIGRSSRIHKVTLPYQITLSDQSKHLIHLWLDTSSGVGQTRMLRFTPDRRSVRESIDIWGHVFNESWRFVSERQTPADTQNLSNL